MMRILRICVFLFLCQLAFGQNINGVFEAIRKVDLVALNVLFDNKMEYCYDNQIEFVDKTIALKALKAFLERNAPKSMTPMHKGNSKGDDSNFAIAIMESTNGKKFRFYIYAETIQGKTLVQELRIDKVN